MAGTPAVRKPTRDRQVIILRIIARPSLGMRRGGWWSTDASTRDKVCAAWRYKGSNQPVTTGRGSGLGARRTAGASRFSFLPDILSREIGRLYGVRSMKIFQTELKREPSGLTNP